MRKAAMLALLVMGGILTGCGMFTKPVEVLRVVEGQIDNVLMTEIADGDGFVSVTHVGFTDGQGVSLVGIHPGLSKGKTVKLKLRFYKVIGGTPYFDVLQINAGIMPEEEFSTLSKQKPTK
jgi:hypothetical protein